MPVPHSNVLTYVAIALLLVACAQVRTPSGGEKDEQAPILMAAEPAPFSTSFSEDRIILEYDEYIDLQGVRDQVIISPPMEERPDITLKNNKKVIIDFKEPLKENTTYTINFGEAIRDYNEGNVLEENLFLFSTGSYIDSLTLSGRLLIANTDEACADCFALLYENLADSAVMTEKPYYLAKSDESGRFSIPFLKEGTYRLYGLDDLNADLEYSRGEAVAFADEPVQVSASDSTDHQLRLFVEEEEELFMTGISPDAQKQSITITFSKDVDSLDFRPLDNGPAPQEILRFQRRDSVEVWFSPLVNDEPISLEVWSGGTLIDTVDVRTDRRSEEFDSLYFAPPTLAHDSAILTLSAQRPLLSLDTALIDLVTDSLPVPFDIERLSARSFSLSADWVGGSHYELSVSPGAIDPLVGPMNDSLEYSFSCPPTESLSQLNVTVNDSSETPMLLLLVPQKAAIEGPTTTVLDLDGTDTYYFRKMPPGKYLLYLLHDENGNGKWDAGELLAHRQAERVLKHNEILQLRPNWELEVVFER